MPNFTIELRTKDRVWESFAVERDDHTKLRIEMVRFVGELLKDHAEQIWVDEDWRVDVTGENGQILFVIQLMVTDTPSGVPMR